MKRTIMAGALTILSAASASALDTKIEEVNVLFDLDAMKSPSAIQFWGNLETDLETAIIERIGPNLVETGTTIDVDIDELTLSSSLQTALGEDSVLKGSVHIYDHETSEANTFYHLTLTVKQAGEFVYGEDYAKILAAPPEATYLQMIDAFADNIVAKLE